MADVTPGSESGGWVSRCPRCRYALSGLPARGVNGRVRCPECGWVGLPPRKPGPWRPSEEHGCAYALVWLAATTVGLVFLLVMVVLVLLAARAL